MMDWHDLAKEGPMWVFITHYALKRALKWLHERKITVVIEQKKAGEDERKDDQGR